MMCCSSIPHPLQILQKIKTQSARAITTLCKGGDNDYLGSADLILPCQLGSYVRMLGDYIQQSAGVVVRSQISKFLDFKSHHSLKFMTWSQSSHTFLTLAVLIINFIRQCLQSSLTTLLYKAKLLAEVYCFQQNSQYTWMLVLQENGNVNFFHCCGHTGKFMCMII